MKINPRTRLAAATAQHGQELPDEACVPVLVGDIRAVLGDTRGCYAARAPKFAIKEEPAVESLGAAFYAEGLEIWKAPISTKTSTGKSIEIGFHAATATDVVGAEGARNIAAMLSEYMRLKKPTFPDLSQERNPIIHQIKTYPEVFQAMRRGEKSFEIRKNDRDYRLGDFLHSREWVPEVDTYSGNADLYQVTFVLYAGQFGVPADYCVMSVSRRPLPMTDQWFEKAVKLEEDGQEISAGVRSEERKEPVYVRAAQTPDDELYEQGVKHVRDSGNASTAKLQRALQLGYNRAAALIERMEAEGVASKADRYGKREVLKVDEARHAD